jgi:hypothetical protein
MSPAISKPTTPLTIASNFGRTSNAIDALKINTERREARRQRNGMCDVIAKHMYVPSIPRARI